MPALGSLVKNKLAVRYAVASVFGFGPRTRPAFPLAVGLIRQAEKAVREYELARRALARWVRWRSLDGFFSGVDHLETCITSLHRASRYAEAIRRGGLQNANGTAVIPKGDGNSVLSSRALRQVALLRNAVEHAHKDIIRGLRPPGKATAIDPRGPTLSIGDHEVTFDTLAAWLTELHATATTVSRYQRAE
jgi:hypothetical protein